MGVPAYTCHVGRHISMLPQAPETPSERFSDILLSTRPLWLLSVRRQCETRMSLCRDCGFNTPSDLKI